MQLDGHCHLLATLSKPGTVLGNLLSLGSNNRIPFKSRLICSLFKFKSRLILINSKQAS
jgi:hypothetical protein